MNPSRNDSPRFRSAKAYACRSHAAADLSRIILGRVILGVVFSVKKVERELMCSQIREVFSRLVTTLSTMRFYI